MTRINLIAFAGAMLVSVAGYAGLRVELPSTSATDAEIDDVVNNERKRRALQGN